MSDWRLPASVRAVAIDEDVVFLDITADSYLCLPGGAAALRDLETPGAVEVDDVALAAQLEAAGLLERRSAGRGIERDIRTPFPPTFSAAPFETSAPAWHDLGDAAIAVAGLLKGYVGRSFAHLVEAAGPSHPQQVLEPPGKDLLDLAIRFNGWIPYAPLPTKCLLRCFMLRRLLRRRGHEAAWVFGVSTWPFQAHCWVQRGEVVLDDTVEHVRAFRPIMVV